MKVSCIQMDMGFCAVDENFAKAQQLIRQAAEQMHPDTIVLPETWNTGFFPKDGLSELSDCDETRVKAEIGTLAKELHVNIVAGSVSNKRGEHIYNTALVFDREGSCIYSYDKIHLFTPSGEDRYYTGGERYATFFLDGVRCGLIICYDLRFPELARSIRDLETDILFVVAQWPDLRIMHMDTLARARAIENQEFVVLNNSCGSAEGVTCGGNSVIYDPLGAQLAKAGPCEEIISAELALDGLSAIRQSINVWRDRKPRLYQVF